MDEILGYFRLPPIHPRGHLAHLAKQGRASVMGVVLVTQNPVDLDYTGLSNAGTGSSEDCKTGATRLAPC